MSQFMVIPIRSKVPNIKGINFTPLYPALHTRHCASLHNSCLEQPLLAIPPPSSGEQNGLQKRSELLSRDLSTGKLCERKPPTPSSPATSELHSVRCVIPSALLRNCADVSLPAFNPFMVCTRPSIIFYPVSSTGRYCSRWKEDSTSDLYPWIHGQ